MRNVIAAIEVVVDEHLPVAMNVVGAAIEIVQLADAQRRDSLDQASEKFRQRPGMAVEIDEDKTFPGFDANRYQPVLPAIEILHAFELRHAFQGAIESIIPSVIRTMQQRRHSAGLRNHGS